MTDANIFEITRADGRSNTEVVLDLVRAGSPGDMLTYQSIADALSVGARPYATTEVNSIVSRAYRRVLKELQRALDNLPRVGYRIAEARDHHRLALARKERADTQMLVGLETLTYANLDELNPNERALHEGTLLVVSAIYSNQKAIERRQDAVELAITKAGIDVGK